MLRLRAPGDRAPGDRAPQRATLQGSRAPATLGLDVTPLGMRAPAMVLQATTGLATLALGTPHMVMPARRNHHIRVAGAQATVSRASRGVPCRRSRASRSHRLRVFVVRCRLGRHAPKGIVRVAPTDGPVSGLGAASSGIGAGPRPQVRVRPQGGAARQAGQAAGVHRVREVVPERQAHVLVLAAVRRVPEDRACSVRAQVWVAGRRMPHTARHRAVPARTGVARGAYRRADGPVAVAARVVAARVRAGGGRAGVRCGRSSKLRSRPATSRRTRRFQRAM